MRERPRLNLGGDYWIVDRLPPNRLAVAPDSWVDVDHLEKVIAARWRRPYAPLSEEHNAG